MLNVGFLGFGNQAEHHASYLAKLFSDRAQIVAIGGILFTDLSMVRQKLSDLGLNNISIYPITSQPMLEDSDGRRSVEDLLSKHPDINVMIISTPPNMHYFQVKTCLKKGVHVLVDKPMALTYKHGQQLVSLANYQQGPYLVVGSQRRYEQVYQYVKQVIKAGKIGRVLSISSVISHSQDWLKGWRLDPSIAGGGVLWDFGWHAIDTITYLLNKRAVAVDAALYYPPDQKIETYANALILFEDDISVNAILNWGAPTNSVYESLQIWGSKGVLFLNRYKPKYDSQAPTVLHQQLDGTILQTDFTGATGKAWAPTEAFFKFLVRTQYSDYDYGQVSDAIVSTGADSLETIRIIEAIYASAKSQKKVYLNPYFQWPVGIKLPWLMKQR